MSKKEIIRLPSSSNLCVPWGTFYPLSFWVPLNSLVSGAGCPLLSFSRQAVEGSLLCRFSEEEQNTTLLKSWNLSNLQSQSLKILCIDFIFPFEWEGYVADCQGCIWTNLQRRCSCSEPSILMLLHFPFSWLHFSFMIPKDFCWGGGREEGRRVGKVIRANYISPGLTKCHKL